jgi:hypothetical protein
MPAGLRFITFFVVFRGGAMGFGRDIMLLGCSSVSLVRGFLVCVRHNYLPLKSNAKTVALHEALRGCQL